MRIGHHQIGGRVILAPMAGVTDRPFRILCRSLGAAMTESEMVTSDSGLWSTVKSRLRMDHRGEPGPRVVQIAGSDPRTMAEAARMNADLGAEIIDINMGCPAKKVCRAEAGSALLADEDRVARILEAVTTAVQVPVTLKIRTGIDPKHRNGVRIAQIAEASGVSSLAVHGRTRDCAFRGSAEYVTIREIKRSVGIPVIANGDIDSPKAARRVLDFTGADAIMIGRAAQGRPWVFREIETYLTTGTLHKKPAIGETLAIMLSHLEALYDFYGEATGVRVARKHIKWFLASLPNTGNLWRAVSGVENSAAQYTALAGSLGRFAACTEGQA
jgi:tRNA-dihydrouridine synthase B